MSPRCSRAPARSYPAGRRAELSPSCCTLCGSQAKAFTNVGFWAGLVPENAYNYTRLEELVAAGALGFKSFMCNSGINDFPNVGEADIAAALPFLKYRGVPFFVHAEVVTDVEADPVGSWAVAGRVECHSARNCCPSGV